MNIKKKFYQKINNKAIYNTFKRRNTLNLLENIDERFNIIKDSLELKKILE